MPRRSILFAAERESLLAFLDTEDELIRDYGAVKVGGGEQFSVGANKR